MELMIPEEKTYNGQFCISLYGNASPLGKTLAMAGMTLQYDSRSPLHKLFDRDRNLIGALLGILVDTANSTVILGNLCLDISNDDPLLAEKIEERVYRYAGSWILFLSTDHCSRVYLDPCGSLSLVYSAEKKLAGSNVGLLIGDKEYVDTFDHDLHRQLGVNNTGWFPGGLTSHKYIKRLMANHYLDLNTWQAVRHWPHRDFTGLITLKESGTRIAELIIATAWALKKDGPTVLAITGGKDSRLLLASCRNFISEINLITINLPGSERDVYLAKKISQIDSTIQHKILPPVKASNEERCLWLYNASHCVGGVNQYYSPSLSPLAGHKYFLSGAAGEVGRAFLWRAGDHADSMLDARGLIARLGLSYQRQLAESLEHWLESVKSYSFFTVLDLAYIELRVSSWAFSQSYSYVLKGDMHQITPFNNRELIGILCNLHPDDRRSEAYIHECIRQMWPALLKVPFNRYGNFKDYLEMLRNITDPSRVASKIRKISIGQ